MKVFRFIDTVHQSVPVDVIVRASDERSFKQRNLELKWSLRLGVKENPKDAIPTPYRHEVACQS
jgi:hypothetical protein